jgi:drug/metabolite transporter (DMT)-like permease
MPKPRSAHPEAAHPEAAHPEAAHPRASGDRVPHFRQDLPIYLQLLGVALVWGGTFVAGRVVAAEVPPFLAAFGRFAVASVALGAIALRHPRQLRPPPRRLWPWLLLLGLTGVFAYNVLFLVGLQTVPAGRGSLIIALNPVAISLASALLLGDRLSPLKLVGIALSLSGAAIAISNGNPLALLAGGFGRGDLALLGCVVSWCAYSLVGKIVMQTLSPLVATTYACGIGAIALGIPAAWEWAHTPNIIFSAATLGGIAYLGLLGSAVGFTAYYNGVRAIGLARASVFINGVPICAILLAALLLREPITPVLAIGAVLVVAGVTCTNR